MKILLISLLLSTSVQASLFKKYDKKSKCDRYSIVSKTQNDQGETTYSREIERGEVEVLDRVIVGMTLDNLTINFQTQTVQAELWLKRFLIRTPLFGDITSPLPVTMKSTNPQFDSFINTLNSDLVLINEVCVSKNYDVKYINFF
jgi:hypothetical protein